MSELEANPGRRIALFQRKEVRRVIHNNEWWFVITDVVAALTDSANPQGYLKDMRRRDLPFAEALKGGGQIATPLGLPFDTAGGRQLLQCWNTEGIFRLVQSIPSPKAEPFKRWLARVGCERIQEIEDPELATKRTRALYKAKGYSDEWIEKRMRSIAIRDELTDEWKKRGVKEQREYGKRFARPVNLPLVGSPRRGDLAPFRGEIPASSTRVKVPRLRRWTRRGHLGEMPLPCSAAQCTHAVRGILASGKRASVEPTFSGNARHELEKKSGRKVVTSGNYLALTQATKKAKRIKP